MHLHVKILKRSSDNSVVNKVAYNSRSNLQDLRTGELYYHRSKGNLIAKEILIPENSPSWLQTLASNREAFWSEIEKREVRKDAQLAREIVFSCPHELSNEQNVSLLRSFVQKEFVAQGMIADFAVHPPPKDGDPRNIHAHVLLTMREIKEDGFGLKVRKWNDRDAVVQLRERWAYEVNQILERHGFDKRFDHRSHEERGIKTKPMSYQGRAYKGRDTRTSPLDITHMLKEIIDNPDKINARKAENLERD